MITLPTLTSLVQETPISPNLLIDEGACSLIQDPSAIWGAGDFLPRRNRLTYSEDFSNAAWTKLQTTINSSNNAGPFGATNATSFSHTNTSGDLGYVPSSEFVAGVTYVFSVYLSAGTASWIRVYLYVGTPAGSATVWFNVATGTQGTQQNSGVGSVISATITNVGGSWYKCTVTGVFSSVTSASGVFVTQVSGDASNTRNVGGTAFVWGAQLTLASTLDQSYQKVTDWTTEVYAWNATKNVPWLRRNMLYVTDLVDGTAVGSATVTNNYTYLSTVCAKCDFPANSSGATNRVNFSSWRNDQVPFVNGVTYVGSISIVASRELSGNERLEIWTKGGIIRLSTLGTVSFTRQSASFVSVISSWDIIYINCLSLSGTPLTIYVRDIQVEVGSTATPYQSIGASWPATYTSLALAAGYPVSIFNDRAGTTAVDVPDTLVGVMLDGSKGYALGSELLSAPGPFTNTTGWIPDISANLAAVSGQLEVTAAGTGFGLAIQSFTTEIGKRYRVVGNVRAGTCSTCYIQAGTSNINGSFGYSSTTSKSLVYLTMSFIATGTTTYVNVLTKNGESGTTVYCSSLSVREVLGYTAIASSDTTRPYLRLDGNGRWYLERDLSDDALPVTFPTTLDNVQYGMEMVVNGGFADGTGWTVAGTNLAISNGTLNLTSGGSGGAAVYQASALTAGKSYLVTYTISAINTTNVYFQGCNDVTGSGSVTSTTARTTTGTFTEVYLATTTTAGFRLRVQQNTGYTATIDNLSVKEVLFNPLGPELVTNGTGDSTIGWIAASSATLSSVSGQLRVTNEGSAYGYAYQVIPTTVGKIYLVVFTRGNGNAGANGYRIGTTLAGLEYASESSGTTGQVTKWITATSSTLYLMLYCWNATTTGVYSEYDNVSIKEVIFVPISLASYSGSVSWQNSSGAVNNYTTLTGTSASGFTATSDGGSTYRGVVTGAYSDGINGMWQIVAGQSYVVEFNLTLTSGALPDYVYLCFSQQSGGSTGRSNQVTPVAGYNKLIITATVSGNFTLAFVHSSASATSYSVSNFKFYTAAGPNIVYTSEGTYTLKDSGLIVPSAYAPTTPKYDYGRMVFSCPSRYDSKIQKYLDGKKGKQYLLGPEILVNGDFSNGSTGWNLQNTVVSNGVATITNTGAWAFAIWSNPSTMFVASKSYLVSFDIVSLTNNGGTGQIQLWAYTTFNTAGKKSIAVSGFAGECIIASSYCTAVIDNFSVKEIVRYHSLGPELVTNGTFDSSAEWTLDTSWSIGSGLCTCVGGQVTAMYAKNSYQFTLGKSYLVTTTVSSYTSGYMRTLFEGGYGYGPGINASGVYSYIVAPGQAGSKLLIQSISGVFVGSVDSVSVREVLY